MPSYSERGQSGRILRQLENTLPAQGAASLKGAPVHAGHATARPLLQQICGRAFFQELNSAHKYKQPGHRVVVSLLTLTSLLCLHVCRRQAGAHALVRALPSAVHCGIEGPKNSCFLSCCFQVEASQQRTRQQQLTHAAPHRTRTMPESRGQCTVHKNQTVHEQRTAATAGETDACPYSRCIKFLYLPMYLPYVHNKAHFSFFSMLGRQLAGPT